MKKITAIAALTFAGLLTAGNALAQQHEVRANVPFSFTAGGKTLPSGNYSITALSGGGIEIKNRDQKVAVLAAAFDTAQKSDKGDVLVFEKHSGQYSLRNILCESVAMNLSLPVEHWKKGSYMEEAMNSPSDGLVLIAVGN